MERVSASQYYRQHLSGLTPLQRHTQLLQHALQDGQHSSSSTAGGLQATETDYDALRKHHRFLRGPEDEAAAQEAASSWGVRLARRYYARLFKEYAIADLSRYKESKVGLRWRTQAEVVSGKGQFSCGAKGCASSSGLAAYEVNFAYQEAGQAKQALVKLCLCEDCAAKLNHRRERGQQYKRLGGMGAGVGMAGERQRGERSGRDRGEGKRQRQQEEVEDMDAQEVWGREKRQKGSYSGREGERELQQRQRSSSGGGSPGRSDRQLREDLAAERRVERESRSRNGSKGDDGGGDGSRVRQHQGAGSSRHEREGGREEGSRGGGRVSSSSRGGVHQQQQGAADRWPPPPPPQQQPPGNASKRARLGGVGTAASESQLQGAPGDSTGAAAASAGGGVLAGVGSRGDDRWQLEGDGGGGEGCTAAEAALAEGDGVGDRWELEDGELNEVDIERWLDSLFTVVPGV